MTGLWGAGAIGWPDVAMAAVIVAGMVLALWIIFGGQ